jgi:glycosyltransferase involved in cell wall biosynthesis
MNDTLDVFMVTYGIVEEGGGPGIAVSGFARALARRGDRVDVISLPRAGHWIVDEAIARESGYLLSIGQSSHLVTQLAELTGSLLQRIRRASRPIVWVNGIWGPPSLAAGLAHVLTQCPFVVRPAGSLGLVALQYRAWKKRIYYPIIERPLLRHAARIHCMSDLELRELPEELRARAFVAASGVDIADPPQPHVGDGALRIGMLARLHPIKRQHLALDAVEILAADGVNVVLELAGGASSSSYAAALRTRVAKSHVLRARVRFLAHVERSQLPSVVGQWRVGLLLSEQENFGHAALVVAAARVPLILTSGVALAADAARAHAGVTVEPNGRAIADAVSRVLAQPGASSESAYAFARLYSWNASGERLHRELAECASFITRE